MERYLRNGTIVSEEGLFHGGLVIRNGRIAQWVAGDPTVDAAEVIDCTGKWILPGLIDAHAHFSEPGRGHWEGFRTGTMAAAAGGITTVIEMPLNASPPTIDGEALHAKQAVVRQESVVDVALWGGLVENNLTKLSELHDGGVVGFKAFLSSSGSDFARIDDDLLYAGLLQAKEYGLPVGVHAENEWVTRYLTAQVQANGRKDTYAWGLARPPAAELETIQRALFWAKTTGGPLHIVHVSLAQGIQMVTAAKAEGVDITVETCPHYLLLDEDDFARIGPAAKCAPPLRARAEVEALWQAVLRGQVDIIGSDHSPCLAEEKTRGNDNIWLAWGGISGIQTMLPALLTEGVQRRGLALPLLVRMMATNPARRFGLFPHKGTLLPGADADIVIVDPQTRWQLSADQLFYKNPHSAFIGTEFTGAVEQTLVRGATVYQAGRILATPGYGQMVQRQNPHEQ